MKGTPLPHEKKCLKWYSIMEEKALSYRTPIGVGDAAAHWGR